MARTLATLFFILLASGALAAGTDQPVKVTSDTLVIRSDQGRIDFSGNVKAVQGDFVLFADQLLAFYETDSRVIKVLKASGHVRFNQGKRSGNAETADYAVPVSELVLEGTPVVMDGPNRLAGKRIQYSTRTGVLRVHGARTTFYRSTMTKPAENDTGRQK